ncbi:MAG: zinc-binding dehydrogenase [Candidatus Marinimicrobia bacterium]|nr:zinc-binding dehydrogenase [Candidatus Neomarinimicrobiota bacterium]
MKHTLPDQMTAVVLESYSGVAALKIEQRSVPKPGKNELLVKVAASPINPSDLAFLEGLYGRKASPPVIPGLEGSGTVVATGTGLLAKYFSGKKIACLAPPGGDGVWAEYMLTTPNYALPLLKTVDLEQGAMSVVNPLTALALLSIARKGGHKSIINTAAASSLGGMIQRVGQTEGIEVINIVRRPEQVELLKKADAAFVLDSSDPHFDRQLQDLCQEQGTRLAFDAVAGPITRRLLHAMPRDSKVTLYGGLSFEPAEAHPGHLIFENKRLDGFWLSSWLAKNNKIQNIQLWRQAQRMMATELHSSIRKKYPLEDVSAAVLDYQNHMTGGKVLIVP